MQSGLIGFRGEPAQRDEESYEWKGNWSANVDYRVNHRVFFDNSSYICIRRHRNRQPPASTYWNPIAMKGGPGEMGNAGANAFSYTTQPFAQPAALGTVTVAIDSGNSLVNWLNIGQPVHVTSGGFYLVTAKPSLGTVTLQNLAYNENASPTAQIASGAVITPAGARGPQGGVGGTGPVGANAFTITVNPFTQPAVEDTVIINVASNAFTVDGQVIVIAIGGHYKVLGRITETFVVAQNLGYFGNASVGTSVPSGRAVAPAGFRGPEGGPPGPPGKAAYTTVTTDFFQPAFGDAVEATFENTAWMVPAFPLSVQGGGFYRVDLVTSPTTALLVNLGYPGNAIEGSTILATSRVAPTGLVGPTGSVSSAAALKLLVQTIAPTTADDEFGLYPVGDDLRFRLPSNGVEYVVAVANRVQTFKAQNATVYTVPYASNIVIDYNLGPLFVLVLTGNPNVSLTNFVAGSSFELLVKQDGVGGRSPLYDNGIFRWRGGLAPVHSSTGNASDIISCRCFDGQTLVCDFGAGYS